VLVDELLDILRPEAENRSLVSEAHHRQARISPGRVVSHPCPGNAELQGYLVERQ